MIKPSLDSLCVQQTPPKMTTAPHQLPIFATSSFVFEKAQDGIDIFTGAANGNVYSRYSNPTIEAVASHIAALEGYELSEEVFGLMTSSGMSAISSVLMALLNQGDHILTQGNLYGGTTELLIKILGNMGIEPKFINMTDLSLVEHHLKQNKAIKVIYLETPSNPTLDCVDLKGISGLARKYGVKTVIDNTFCTPYIQRPLAHGIDYVIHSTTKYLNGHGNSIAGAIVGRQSEEAYKIWEVVKLAGTNCNAWDAWLVANGLKTLPLRMQRHSSNAQALAAYLQVHPKVSKVNYTGLPNHPYHQVACQQMDLHGGMLSFELKGGTKEAIAFMDNLKMITQAPTLGDVNSLVLHPATSSHLKVPAELKVANGITDGLVRLSVGIEEAADLLNDVEQALMKV